MPHLLLVVALSSVILTFVSSAPDFEPIDTGIVCDGQEPEEQTEDGERLALSNKDKYWKEGIVPYVIEDNYSDKHLKMIRDAMAGFHKVTCIRFIPRTDEKAYIGIVDGSQCSAGVGSNGRRRRIQLKSSTCFDSSGTTIRHELMHILGFHHEMVRPDRDEYITIKWENIEPGSVHNFEIEPEDQTMTQDLAYDYTSIMHYSSRQASANGKPTMVAKRLGQFLGLSFGKKFSNLDVKRINKLYKCEGF